jgi:carbonic anhydrase
MLKSLTTTSMIERRSLIRLGGLAAVGAAVAPALHASRAEAGLWPTPPGPFCNSNRPTMAGEALNALIEGNYRWATETQIHPNQDTATRECFADGTAQTPFATVLACVDSRVPTEIIFDQGLGDLLTARVAGNSLVPILQDSLRYGADTLGVLVVFVLGHSSCGAVSAAVESFKTGQPSFAFEIPIYPAVEAARAIVANQGGDPDDNSLVAPIAIDQHVIQTVQQLSLTPRFDQLATNPNRLLIKGGRYDISNQTVAILI